MEEFIENAHLIMWALSVNIFDSITEIPKDSPKNIEEIILYLKRKIQSINFTVSGICRKTAEGFVVLKGSQLSPEVKDAVSMEIKKRRASAKIDSNYILQEDIVFSSPSGAAEFIVGNSSNGWRVWKNKDGVELKDLDI